MPRRFKRGGFRRARSFIRRTVVNMGPIESKRIVFGGDTIQDRTSVAYDNPQNFDLLVAQESVDEEVVSDGSTVAEVKPYSKIVGFKWKGYIQGPVSEVINLRWVLYKMPDGEDLLTGGLIDSVFHGSGDTPTQRELRGLILSKGILHLDENKGVTPFSLFIRRKTLRRIGNLREGDKIRLAIALGSAPTTQPTLFGFGTMYVRMN